MTWAKVLRCAVYFVAVVFDVALVVATLTYIFTGVLLYGTEARTFLCGGAAMFMTFIAMMIWAYPGNSGVQ